MTAARTLEPAVEPDPVLAAFLDAPLAEDPETEEERAAFEEGIADIRAGRVRTRSGAEVHADIERVRRGLERFGIAAEEANITLGEALHWLDTGSASPAIAALLTGERSAAAE